MPAEQPGDSDFDRIVDELYAAPPEEFVAVRDEHVKQAREAGDRDLVRTLRELRRPSRPAWLVNLLWQERQETLERLLDLGGALRSAQERADGSTLRELSDARRRLVDGLLGQARGLAAEAGLSSVPADVERAVQQTLEAALADPDVADQVRTGRLVKPAEYTGFGVGPAEVAVVSRPPARAKPAADKPAAAKPGAKSPAKPAAKSPARSAPGRPRNDEERAERAKRAEAAAQREREDRQQRAREAAERAVEEARERLESAEQDLDANEHALQDAIRHRDDLTAEVQQLRERIRETERQSRAAESDVRSATTRRNRSDTAYSRAEERLRDAEEALDNLP